MPPFLGDRGPTGDAPARVTALVLFVMLVTVARRLPPAQGNVLVLGCCIALALVNGKSIASVFRSFRKIE